MTEHTTGVVYGLASEAYHAGPGLSHSGAKRLMRSPFHYWALAQQREAPPKAPTPQMVNGTLVHCALLEPEQFDVRYAVIPDDLGTKASKAYKEWAAVVLTNGCEAITPQQRDAAQAQADALRTLPIVQQLMAGDHVGHAESSAYWVDPDSGVHCKCRPDWASHGWGDDGRGVLLLDVKTTADASPEAFAKSVVNFGYHTQDDWYCQGYGIAARLPVLGMVFVVVESEFPHAVAAYSLDADALQLARMKNRDARALYAQCATKNEWPSYPREVTELSLPRWALKELTE